MINQNGNTEEVKALLEVDNRGSWVEMKESLDRLVTDPDFNKVILQGYFRDYAVEGVSLLAAEQIVRSGARPAVMERLIAISQLEDYFHTIQSMGSVPDMEDDEDEEIEG